MDALIKTLTTARQDVARIQQTLDRINTELSQAQTVVQTIENTIRKEALNSYVLAIKCHPGRRT